MSAVASDDSSISALLSKWLDHRWEARFLLDEQLTIRWSNGAAETWLRDDHCPVQSRDGMLAGKETRLHARLASLVSGLDQNSIGTFTFGANCTRELLFCARQVGRFDGLACIGLGVRKIQDVDAHHLVGLGDAYDLTRSEEAVLQQMVRGHTVEAIAKTSKTSPETIRTHVRRAYSKMGVSSREEMFRRIRPFIFAR